MKKIKLSFQKLADLLNKKKYKILSIYCENQYVKFLECRTPIYQKNFFIHIPDRYVLEKIRIDNLKVYNLKSLEEPPSSTHMEYMTNIKKDNVDFDLVEINDKDLFFYSCDTTYKYYTKINEKDKHKEDNDNEKISINNNEDLIRESKKLIKKYDPSFSLKTKEDEEEEIEEEIEEGEEEGEEDEVQLVFQNKDGELVDDVKDAIEGEESGEIPKFDDLLEDENDNNDGNIERKNIVGYNLPYSIEDVEVYIGAMIICVNIRNFIKQIDQYEKIFSEQAEKLDHNEDEYRKKSIEKIKKLCDRYYEKVQIKSSEFEKRERDLKAESVKINLILAEIEKLIHEQKQKDGEKYKEDIAKLEYIYQKTLETIFEVNINLMKVKDEYFEFIANHTLTLQHTLKL